MLTFAGCFTGASSNRQHAAIHVSIEFTYCSAGSGHTAVVVDPGVLDTALARDYFRSEVRCAAEAQPSWVLLRV